MQHFILFSIILVEGFVSIATEIITIRQLLPVVGGSVEVTSYIIGIFLLALAYGYKRGGQYTKNLTAILQRNFLIASLLLGLGLSYNFIVLFFTSVHTWSLFLFLIIVITPLVYLLGQTIPITMNLLSENRRAGEVGSKVLHFSTVGSFFGAILTTVLFMNYIGVTWTVIVNSALLSLAAIIIARKHRGRVAAILVVFMSFTLLVNLYDGRHKTLHTNAYNSYQLINKFHNDDALVGKLLVVNHSGSSFLDDKTLAGSKYIEMIKKIIFHDLKTTGQDILVLGAGGFSLSAATTNENNFIYVDIDPDIEMVTKEYFQQQINGTFVAQDARQYLRNSKQQFPIIVADTYSERTTIPAHLITHEYFDLIEHNLTDSGIAIINVIINPMLLDPYSLGVDTTIRASFDRCMSVPKEYANAAKNVLYICNKNDRSLVKQVYSDDLNRSTLDKLAVN